MKSIDTKSVLIGFLSCLCLVLLMGHTRYEMPIKAKDVQLDYMTEVAPIYDINLQGFLEEIYSKILDLETNSNRKIFRLETSLNLKIRDLETLIIGHELLGH